MENSVDKALLKPLFSPEEKPEIIYPCIWPYTVMSKADLDVKALLQELISDRDFSLKPSKKTKNLRGYKLEVEVRSEEERLELFSLLKHKFLFVL